MSLNELLIATGSGVVLLLTVWVVCKFFNRISPFDD